MTEISKREMELAEVQASVNVSKLMANCDRTPEVLGAMKELLEAGRIPPAIQEKDQFIGEAPREEWSDIFVKLPPQFYYVVIPLCFALLSLMLYTSFGTFMIYLSIVVLFGYLFRFIETVHINKVKGQLNIRKMETNKEIQTMSDKTMSYLLTSANALNKDKLDVVNDIVAAQAEIQQKKMKYAKELHSSELKTNLDLKTLEEGGMRKRLDIAIVSETTIAQLKSETELGIKDKNSELEVQVKQIEKQIALQEQNSKIAQQKLQSEAAIKVKILESESTQKQLANLLENEKAVEEAKLRNSTEQKRLELNEMAKQMDFELKRNQIESEKMIQAEKERTKRFKIAEGERTKRYDINC